LLLAFSASAVSAHDEVELRARLTGFQESPSISTQGKGDFRAQIGSNGTSLSFRLRYEDLEGGPVLFAHIHLGQRGVNGGVMAFLCGGGGKPACPASPATVNGTITAADISGPAAQGISTGEFAEFIRALRSGNSYANVHTDKFSGGEIRGQIKDDDDDHNDHNDR